MEINSSTLPAGLSGGLEAYSRSNEQIEQAGREIVAQTTKTAEPRATSLEESLVSLTESSNYAKAGVKVIEAEKAMLGMLLDTEA